ncbi:probable mannitol dehydrogenase [Syzygium oleosum]|uniref:probable mannitol dehydrogenase n=1 Tax=Syzygium oleosum TaxID=219896 RepID=UPI0024B9F4BE|nr:probable mannitol dehydrogenase [Syzygium oleosum]
MILSYGGKYYNGTTTCGGYSDIMVLDEHLMIKIPDNLPLYAVAPLLCAGIIVYIPLKYYGLDKAGMHLGVVGLGHMAVKFAKDMGLKVTVKDTSPNIKNEAVVHLGADAFLLVKGTMDNIIDRISAMHALLSLTGLLKANGTLVKVGAPEKPLELLAFSLLTGKRKQGL